MDFIFSKNISLPQLYNFLLKIDDSFIPKLSSRVELTEYAIKLFENAVIFSVLSVDKKDVIGAILLYCNDKEKKNAYIPIVGVLKEFRGLGITKILFGKVEKLLKETGFKSLSLETWFGSDALPYYIKNGFYIEQTIFDRPDKGMSIKLKKELQLNFDCFQFNSTPLTEISRLNSKLGVKLLIKRDDLFEITGGGSKGRKLKYILKKAINQGCNSIVTAGGIQSNHVRATALMSSELSMSVAAIIHDKKPTEYYANLKLTSLSGAKISFVEMKNVKYSMDQEVNNFIKNGFKPFYIWGGGHSIEGTFAYYNAVLELKSQLKDLVPDFIVVASGTGTTQAGIEVGVKQLFPKCKVLGVSVAREKAKGTKVIIESANDLIGQLNNGIESIEKVFFDDSKMGKGYEDTFPSLIDLIHNMANEYGLILDPTYSGKAFFGLTQYIKDGIIPVGSTVIFWHTGSMLNLLASKTI